MSDTGDNVTSLGPRMQGAQNSGSSYGSASGGDGGGFDRGYIDARIEAVKAQNDARFAEVISRLDNMHPATWWQNGLLLIGAVGFVFAILSYASDRFDSGVSAMGAIEEQMDAQRDTNAAQDARLDKILRTLEVQSAKPQGSPEVGQD